MGESKSICRQTKQTLQRFVQCENYTPLTPMTVEKFATSCQLVPVCSHKLHMYHSAISLFKKYTYVFHAYAFQFRDSQRKRSIFSKIFYSDLNSTFFQETAYPIVQLNRKNCAMKIFHIFLNIFYWRKRRNNNIHRNSIFFLVEIELQRVILFE